MPRAPQAPPVAARQRVTRGEPIAPPSPQLPIVDGLVVVALAADAVDQDGFEAEPAPAPLVGVLWNDATLLKYKVGLLPWLFYVGLAIGFFGLLALPTSSGFGSLFAGLCFIIGYAAAGLSFARWQRYRPRLVVFEADGRMVEPAFSWDTRTTDRVVAGCFLLGFSALTIIVFVTKTAPSDATRLLVLAALGVCVLVFAYFFNVFGFAHGRREATALGRWTTIVQFQAMPSRQRGWKPTFEDREFDPMDVYALQRSGRQILISRQNYTPECGSIMTTALETAWMEARVVAAQDMAHGLLADSMQRELLAMDGMAF